MLQKQRAATAREINKFADAIEAAIPDIIASLKRGNAAIEAGRFLFGTIGPYELLDQLERDLPSSLAILASEMRARAEQTIAGPAPALLPMPEVVALPAPPIPRQTIFLLKDAKWRNPARPHEFEFAERFSFASVPVELANKALESGVAVLPESEQAQKWKFNKRGCPPLPEKCVDLDTGELPKPPSGPVPWNFRAFDRGPAMKVRLSPAPSFEPAAARQAPLQNNETDHE